jgi:hypothetical protein
MGDDTPSVVGCVIRVFCTLSLLASCAEPPRPASESGLESHSEIPVSLRRDASASACPFNEYVLDWQTAGHQWFALVPDASGDAVSHYVSIEQPERRVLEAGGQPLLLDGNHLDSGPLYLLAIAWTDIGIDAFPATYFKDAPAVKPRGLGTPCIDLRNTWLRIRAKPEHLDLHGGELVFWFQNYDPYAQKIVNYAFTKSRINVQLKSEEFSNVCINLTDSLDDWTCLGSNKMDRRLIYGCSSDRTRFRQVLSHVTNDLGLIVRHDTVSDASTAPIQAPDGKLMISELGIWAHYPGEDKCGESRLSEQNDSLAK